MKIKFIWNDIKDVPSITLEWAKLVAGNDVSIDEVNELVNEYEHYSNLLDDIDYKYLE